MTQLLVDNKIPIIKTHFVVSNNELYHLEMSFFDYLNLEPQF